jgi:hypothetical protein
MPHLSIQTTSIGRGVPLSLDFTLSPEENISTWQLRFTLAARRNSADKLLTIDTEDLVITDAEVGIFSVVLESADTDREPRSYWWDVWRIDPGQERLLAIGYLTIEGVVRLPAEA